MALGDRLRAGRTRMRTVGAAVALVVVASGALWLSGLTPGWLAPALSGVVTAVLIEEAVRRQRRVPLGDPVDVHVTVGAASYVRVPAQAGEPPRQVPVSGHSVRMVVTAADRTLVLTGLRVVVLERRLPRGELMPAAGVLPVRAYTALLDEDPPVLRPTGPDTPPDFSYTVGPDDPEIFEIRVETARWLVTWVLELDWVHGRRSGTVRVDLAGHPFRTVARPPRGLSWDDEPN